MMYKILYFKGMGEAILFFGDGFWAFAGGNGSLGTCMGTDNFFGQVHRKDLGGNCIKGHFF
jgi:hypothetical protein